MTTINTTNATAGLTLEPGKHYVWRVGTPSANGTQYTEWSGPFTALTPLNNTDLTTSDLDMGGNRVLFANVYSTLAELPDASTYHGMFAHVHSEGAAYYAHAGNWVRLADNGHGHEISNVTGLQSSLDSKASAEHSHLKSNITDLTTSDLDMGGNRVLFANYYATQEDFPDATTYHGMVAHSHADGAFYGAHAGAWVRLANYGDIPAATTVNGLSGDVTLVEGDNVNLTTSGQNITIAVPDAGITWSTPPQSSSSPGSPGDVAYDDNYFYLRTSQAWRQVALSSISTAITISQQPADASVEDGDSASFTVLATAGGETISYQWEASTDNGSTFADLSGETSNTLAVTASLAGNGTQYRVGLSAAGAADVTSSVATLTVGETFRVMSESGDDLTLESGGYLLHDGVAQPVTATLSVVGPSNQTAVDGNATFSVSATVSDGSALSYQWETIQESAEQWQQQPLTGVEDWSSIAFGDGLFVAVARGSNIAATSTDGINWTQETIFLPVAEWIGVTYGDDGFVALSVTPNDAYNSTGMYSARRTSTGDWFRSTVPTGYYYSLAYGNGLYLAVGASQSDFLLSLDGLTWSREYGPLSSYSFKSVAYGNGTFVAVSDTESSQGGYAITTTNGSEWAAHLMPSSSSPNYGGWSSVAYGEGKFVAAPRYSNIFASSPDGITWTAHMLPSYTIGLTTYGSAKEWSSIAYGDGKFVAVASNADIVAISEDGVNWEIRFLTLSSEWKSIAAGDAGFVAVASNSGVAAFSEATKFLPISGETGSSLALTDPTLSDDGNRYRVIVDSPSVEPVTSDAATLTVN